MADDLSKALLSGGSHPDAFATPIDSGSSSPRSLGGRSGSASDPAAGAVVVWWMAVASPQPATLARWQASLAPDEQARADAFHLAADRETSIAAHALKRALLANVGGLSAAGWRFVVGPYGKPEIDPALERPRLRFNLAHARGLVACAAGLDHDLGLDIERLCHVREAIDVAERFFAPAEVALMRQSTLADQPDTFLRIWTLKEAYIKATGQGLTCPLDGFAFALQPIGIRFRADLVDDASQWQFAQWRPTPDSVIAVAQRAGPTPPIKVIERAVAPATL